MNCIYRRDVIDRAIKVGEFFIEKKPTIREAAKIMGYSKSTIHSDLHRLSEISPQLYEEIKPLLIENKKQGVIKGGKIAGAMTKKKAVSL